MATAGSTDKEKVLEGVTVTVPEGSGPPIGTLCPSMVTIRDPVAAPAGMIKTMLVSLQLTMGALIVPPVWSVGVT